MQKKNCGSTVRLLIALSGAALRFVRGCLLGLGAGIKQSLRGGEKRKVHGIHRRREWGQERLPQVFCCRARHESGGLDLEEHREENIYKQPTCFSGRCPPCYIQ